MIAEGKSNLGQLITGKYTRKKSKKTGYFEIPPIDRLCLSRHLRK